MAVGFGGEGVYSDVQSVLYESRGKMVSLAQRDAEYASDYAVWNQASATYHIGNWGGSGLVGGDYGGDVVLSPVDQLSVYDSQVEDVSVDDSGY